jgi:inorganic phosphate transporter, PiT family
MNILLAAADLTNQAMTTSVEPTGTITTGAMILLVLAVGLALAFEFVNGFHDTANAVATVIYTHSLKPWIAVIWSGCWNLAGVLVSSGGVAFGVLALLPVGMMLNIGSSAGFAMVFALLLSAIIWNLGTWYLGLPASSSHSLFGAILGVGLASAMLSSSHNPSDGVNWAKLRETMFALMLSPLIGFVFAGLLLLLSKLVLRWPALYQAPDKDKAPPLPIRALLVLTCTGVSFGHGSNDGQKGMGLLLLILIGILPGSYALNPKTSSQDLIALHSTAGQVQTMLVAEIPAGTTTPANASDVLTNYLKSSGVYNNQIIPALTAVNGQIIAGLNGKNSISDLTTTERTQLRTNMYETTGVLTKLEAQKQITDPKLLTLVDKSKVGYKAQLTGVTNFIPFWVKLATALALGLGTMIGWKRIVVTVGEKIGKTHLTYAQGASAELVAAATILLADQYHLPVSTTHVLSSGVAGTMAANHSGLQMQTLRNLLLAWVLTLPVCVMLGAALFAASLVAVLYNLLPIVIGIMVVAVVGWIGWRFKSLPKRSRSMFANPAT